MISSLKDLGINDTQQLCYFELVKSGPVSATKLASSINLKRTTVHMALEKLTELGLVEKAEEKGVWQANNPTELKRLLAQRQNELKQSAQELQSSLPAIISRYRLSHQQPGVLHIEGKNGIKYLHDDIIRNNKEVLIFTSSKDRDNPEIALAIDAQITRQEIAGIKVRALSSVTLKDDKTLISIGNKRITERFFGDEQQSSQTIIYGDNVAISTFGETMYTTIITSPEIADSYRSMFENQWTLAS